MSETAMADGVDAAGWLVDWVNRLSDAELMLLAAWLPGRDRKVARGTPCPAAVSGLVERVLVAGRLKTLYAAEPEPVWRRIEVEAAALQRCLRSAVVEARVVGTAGPASELVAEMRTLVAEARSVGVPLEVLHAMARSWQLGSAELVAAAAALA